MNFQIDFMICPLECPEKLMVGLCYQARAAYTCTMHVPLIHYLCSQMYQRHQINTVNTHVTLIQSLYIQMYLRQR